MCPKRWEIDGLNNLLKSAGNACTSFLGNKVLYQMIINKYDKHKKQYGKDHLGIQSFKKLYGKNLHDKFNKISEYESLSNCVTIYLVETKNESFYKQEQYNKNKFFW